MVSQGSALTATLNNTNPCIVSSVNWSGSNTQVVNILNESVVNDALIEQLRTICP